MWFGKSGRRRRRSRGWMLMRMMIVIRIGDDDFGGFGRLYRFVWVR